MTSVQPMGQRALEDVLAVMQGALIEGSTRSAGPAHTSSGVFSPTVRAWVADTKQGVAAAVGSVEGADAARKILACLAPSALTVEAAVPTDRFCWAEITWRGDGDPETCLLGLTLDAARLVGRLVLLRAPLVPALSSGAPPSAPSGRPLVEAYFDDLMNSRFRDAAAHFSLDALYSHPPYAGGSHRVLYSGREALWRGFAVERGPTPARQVITGFWQINDRVFIEGVIDGIPEGGTFFSTAQISSHGEIARYVAFYSARRIPSA